MAITRDQLETGGKRRSQLQINRRKRGAPADIRDKITPVVPQVHARSRRLSVAPKLGKSLGVQFAEALEGFAPNLGKLLDQRDSRAELEGTRAAARGEDMPDEKLRAYERGYNKHTGTKLGLDVQQRLSQRIESEPDTNPQDIIKEELERSFGKNFDDIEPTIKAAASDILEKAIPKVLAERNEQMYNRRRSEDLSEQVSTHGRRMAEARAGGYDTPAHLREMDNALQDDLRRDGYDQKLIDELRINSMGEHYLRRQDPAGLVEHFMKPDPNGHAMIDGPNGKAIRDRATSIENYWYSQQQRENAADAAALKVAREDFEYEFVIQAVEASRLTTGEDKMLRVNELANQIKDPRHSNLVDPTWGKKMLDYLYGDLDQHEDINVRRFLELGVRDGRTTPQDLYDANFNNSITMETYSALLGKIHQAASGKDAGPKIYKDQRVKNAVRRITGNFGGTPDDISGMDKKDQIRSTEATAYFYDQVEKIDLAMSTEKVGKAIDLAYEDTERTFMHDKVPSNFARPLALEAGTNPTVVRLRQKTRRLLDAGIITDDEYQAQRELLDRWQNSSATNMGPDGFSRTDWSIVRGD